jgi:hypothetical protein
VFIAVESGVSRSTQIRQADRQTVRNSGDRCLCNDGGKESEESVCDDDPRPTTESREPRMRNPFHSAQLQLLSARSAEAFVSSVSESEQQGTDLTASRPSVLPSVPVAMVPLASKLPRRGWQGFDSSFSSIKLRSGGQPCAETGMWLKAHTKARRVAQLAPF